MAIEHRQLEVFRAIMTSGSVTSAAGMLHSSQPTLSRDLARLEQQLGFTLFDRIRGRLQPTTRAQVLFEEVQRSYIGLERILATAASLSQFAHGQLSIVCLPVFSHSLLPAVCRRFMTEYPGASIAITPQESPLLEEWLTTQRHDLGLTEHDSPPPATRIRNLLVANEVCVIPDGHPLLSRPVLSPRDFADERFISLSPTDPYRLQLDDVFRAHAISRRMVLETHSAVSVCSMVREGLGVAIVNPLTALDFAGRGLSIRPFSEAIPFRVSLVSPEHRPSSPLTEHFIAALRAEADAISKRLLLVSREDAAARNSSE